MTDEAQMNNWKVVWVGDDFPPSICDLDGNPIATIHKSSNHKTLARAGLIASAPGMFDALIGALEVFRVIAEHAEEPASLAAEDMIPILESALEAANFLAPISVEELKGT